MSGLRQALGDYVALRRSLGYKLTRASQVLDQFVDHLEALGEDVVTVEAAVSWAMQTSNPESRWRADRLTMVRGFARYLHVVVDDAHEIPPSGLISRGRGRPAPFLFSDNDVVALMAAARQVPTVLRAATIETFIGLLASTGLRVSEGIRLDADDVNVDAGMVHVRHSKADKSRDVPISASTATALDAYARRRDAAFVRPRQPSFFVTTTGTRLHAGNLGDLFASLLGPAGLAERTTKDRRPRLGGLRHSFAVNTLADWHRCGVDVEARLPLLSTYLGHATPSSTYWYLSASPELLAAAATRLAPIGIRP